jgi:hypothetical protein
VLLLFIVMLVFIVVLVMIVMPVWVPVLGFCRGDRIRTCDLSVPNRALYQAELRPGIPSISRSVEVPGDE